MKLSLKNGLFLGILIGIASAFLYAPKSGKELREELKEKSKNIPDNFFNLLESIVDLIVSVFDFTKTAFIEQREKISKAVSCGATVAKEKKEELKKFAGISVKDHA